MLKMKENKIKLIGISILLVAILGLVVYGVYYAIKNHNRSDIMTLDKIDASYTLSEDQLDTIKQPNVEEAVTLDTLPETTSTIQEVNLKTMEKLFKTSQKSILVLVKDGCSFCEDYLPKLKEALEYYEISAYEINISNLKQNEYNELFNYVDFEGTPTTYVIQNSKVLHTLTGTTDIETIISFIDYFYIRNN